MSSERERAIHVPGGAIAALEGGTGEPVLILHGGPGLGDYTQALAAELASFMSTVHYQQRGLDPTTVRGPYSVESHVADAVAVMDELDLGRPWLAGHSWGAHLAMHVAAAHPGRVRGLILIGGLGATGDGGEAGMSESFSKRVPAAEMARMEEIDRRAMAGEGGPEEAVESLRLLWPYYFADPEAAPPMPPMTMSVECYAETWASVKDHLGHGTLESAMRRHSGPALIIHGDHDPIPLSAAEATAALIPGSRLEVMAGVGHFPWIERPGEIARLVRTITG